MYHKRRRLAAKNRRSTRKPATRVTLLLIVYQTGQTPQACCNLPKFAPKHRPGILYKHESISERSSAAQCGNFTPTPAQKEGQCRGQVPREWFCGSLPASPGADCRLRARRRYGLSPARSWTWTADRRTNVNLYQIDQAWVLGFLSGVGYMGNANLDPLQGLNFHAVTAWIDNYCQRYPLQGIEAAAKGIPDRASTLGSPHSGSLECPLSGAIPLQPSGKQGAASSAAPLRVRW
jgi:hypothetical protein